MRVSRWTKEIDYSEGSASNAGFPDMPDWFNDNRDFNNIRESSLSIVMASNEADAVMGFN